MPCGCFHFGTPPNIAESSFVNTPQQQYAKEQMTETWNMLTEWESERNERTNERREVKKKSNYKIIFPSFIVVDWRTFVELWCGPRFLLSLLHSCVFYIYFSLSNISNKYTLLTIYSSGKKNPIKNKHSNCSFRFVFFAFFHWIGHFDAFACIIFIKVINIGWINRSVVYIVWVLLLFEFSFKSICDSKKSFTNTMERAEQFENLFIRIS